MYPDVAGPVSRTVPIAKICEQFGSVGSVIGKVRRSKVVEDVLLRHRTGPRVQPVHLQKSAQAFEISGAVLVAFGLLVETVLVLNRGEFCLKVVFWSMS